MTESKKVYINENEIEFREYQDSIANKCVGKNSLVVLPTGLGKTIIGIYVAGKTMERYPPESKVIMMAPTRPLISQHYESFLKFLSVPKEKFIILTGKTVPEKRAKLFITSQVLFYTPQTLRNDLVTGKYSLENVCIIIFDEAHHASGDYPYTMIAEKYMEQNPDGNILALTASPGSSKKRIAELCNVLHIPVNNTHFRTRQDSDVKQYLKPMDIFKIGVDLTSLMEDVYATLLVVLEERLQYLSQFNFIEKKSEPLHKKTYRKDLLKLNTTLAKTLSGGGDKTGVYSALSINAQALIVFHMLELTEQQGLNILLTYLEKVNKDARKKTSSKAVKILAADGRIRNIFLNLRECQEFNPEELVHPKFLVLKHLLVNELKVHTEGRVLVFVKLRDSVRILTNKLKQHELLKVERFVGQATKSKADKGLSQKKQLEILSRFKDGDLNVLVSTNVGEEGLDIAECDLVVFYDVVASEIRLIQRKGRTARFREGKVVILYSKHTRDEIILKIALSKLKKMKENLRNHDGLQEYLTEMKKEKAPSAISSEQGQFAPAPSRRQSDLLTFIESGKSNPSPKKDDTVRFAISHILPTKFGLRKKLSEHDIKTEIRESKYDIVIFDKILINIYAPRLLNEESLLKRLLLLKSRFELVISVFDFIDFIEEFEGEERLAKKKIREIGEKEHLQVIPVNNPEELFFIIKNIYDHNRA